MGDLGDLGDLSDLSDQVALGLVEIWRKSDRGIMTTLTSCSVAMKVYFILLTVQKQKKEGNDKVNDK
jgi:hypothetical protein